LPDENGKRARNVIRSSARPCRLKESRYEKEEIATLVKYRLEQAQIALSEVVTGLSFTA